MKKTLRLFIAVPIPNAVVRFLKNMRAALQHPGMNIRWVPVENIHLTLKFLGDIEAASVDPVAERMDAAAEARSLVRWVERLQQGQQAVLVSDAGTPLVSDPGERLVRAVIEAGHAVVPVPGPSAVLSALVAFAWLPYYPLWGILFIAVSIAIIWSLTAHGRDITAA